MKSRTIAVVLLSFLYSVGQITFGLLLHPYQTMQSLVKEKVFVWMTLLPSVVLALVTMVWKWGVVPLVRVVFSCQQTDFFLCQLLPFLSNWLTFFCIYWQVILFYLLLRFRLAYGRKV